MSAALTLAGSFLESLAGVMGFFPSPGVFSRPAEAPDDWSPPNTRVLIATFGSMNFTPSSGTSLPRDFTTFLMPAKPANDLAVVLNARELQDGKREGRWFSVVRSHGSGYAVLAMQRDCRWTPESEFDFPPSILPSDYSNLVAMREAIRFNRQVIREGIDGRFNWAFAVRPLVPLWNREVGA